MEATAAAVGCSVPKRRLKDTADNLLRESVPVAESFSISSERLTVTRTVALREGGTSATSFRLRHPHREKNPTQAQLAALVDAAFLKHGKWPATKPDALEIRVVDLFSGCGLMSLGVWEAARAIGRRMRPVLALDFDPYSATVYKANFPLATVLEQDVREVLPSRLGAKATSIEQEFAESVGAVDVLIGGPPCQGHSDLNNYTRRSDPKNRLYHRMARFAELVRPAHIIIENVPAVTHDKGRVLQRTTKCLAHLGYALDHKLIEASDLGIPQRRRRHFLVASLTRKPNIEEDLKPYICPRRNVAWAIGDLRRASANGSFDAPSVATKKMTKRMDYLFDHELYDLPNSQRPKCHKEKEHSYDSVYGRMHWEMPSQTITGGFMCMGQGRFVHPKQRRTITPHEAARLQFVPDFFNLSIDIPRTALARVIGNAVPSKLSYVLALELLR